MDQRPPREADSCSNDQEIYNLLYNTQMCPSITQQLNAYAPQ